MYSRTKRDQMFTQALTSKGPLPQYFYGIRQDINQNI